MAELSDLIDAATDLLKRRGDVSLDLLKAYGFDELAVARHGGLAISRARQRRIDRRVNTIRLAEQNRRRP